MKQLFNNKYEKKITLVKFNLHVIPVFKLIEDHDARQIFGPKQFIAFGRTNVQVVLI